MTLALFLLAFAAVPAPDASTRPSARLRYARLDATSQACPGPAQAEAAVRTRLGYDPFHADAKDVIEVFIERFEGGLRARLQLKDADGTARGKRVISSPATDCTELSSALTLAIAIAVDPQSFLGGPPTPPIASAPVAAAPPTVDAAPPPPPLVEAERSALKFHAGVALLGLIGTSPGVTGGFAVRAGLHGERWSVSLDGRAELPRALAVGPGEVSVTHLAGLVAPCFHLSYFGACAVFGAGVTRIGSTGLEGSRDGAALFLQAGGRLQALFPLSERVSLGGSVDVLVPLSRTILMVGDEQLWSSPPLNGNAALVVAFSLG
jgi:hypothetical protein